MEIDKTINAAIEEHYAHIRTLKGLSAELGALEYKNMQRNIVRVSKDNSSGLKYKDGALQLLNSGFEITIEISRDSLRNLVSGMMKDISL